MFKKTVDKFFSLGNTPQNVIAIIVSILAGFSSNYVHELFKLTAGKIPSHDSFWLRSMVLVIVVVITNLYFLNTKRKQRAVQLELIKLAEKMKELAITDGLTGLYNRRFLNLEAPRMIANASRHNRSICICFIDIDDFKVINDAYGHLIGDKALTHFSATLLNAVRIGDLVVRYGGDEFLVMWETNDEKKADDLLKRIDMALSEMKFAPDGDNIPLTASIGFSCTKVISETKYEDLIKMADENLFANKNYK